MLPFLKTKGSPSAPLPSSLTRMQQQTFPIYLFTSSYFNHLKPENTKLTFQSTQCCQTDSQPYKAVSHP